MKKDYLSKLLIVVIFGLFVSLYFSIQFKEKELSVDDIEQKLKQKATPSYLENKILDSLERDNVDEALMYKKLADFLNIKISQKTLDKLEEANSFFNKTYREAKHFSKGFFTGEGEDLSSLSGAIVSDMTFVGDFRDLYQEGKKMANSQDYDKIVLGLSAVGVVLTLSTYLSVGAEAPIKVGESILKSAKKTKNLTKKFGEVLLSKVFKSIDIKVLKRVDYTSISSLKKSANYLFKNIDLKPVKRLMLDVGELSKNTSKIEAIKLMKYVDKPKDLEKIIKLSKKFGENTLAVVKILGKGILKSTKKVLEYTFSIIFEAIALVASFIMLLSLKFGSRLLLRG